MANPKKADGKAAAKTPVATKPSKPEDKSISKRQFPPETRIKVLKKSNPYREGSKRGQVLEVLLGCSTVGEATTKCAGKGLKRQPSVKALGRAVEKGIIEINVTASA